MSANRQEYDYCQLQLELSENRHLDLQLRGVELAHHCAALKVDNTASHLNRFENQRSQEAKGETDRPFFNQKKNETPGAELEGRPVRRQARGEGRVYGDDEGSGRRHLDARRNCAAAEERDYLKEGEQPGERQADEY